MRKTNRFLSGLKFRIILPIAGAFLFLASAPAPARAPAVPQWGRFERAFESSVDYAEPVQEASLDVVFKSPSGESHKVCGFWDGGRTWRVRFAPNRTGRWTFETACNDPGNASLHRQRGEFECLPPAGKSRFERHGPIRIAPDRHSLMHEDGTPFFWLADTAWNGPLLSTPDEWEFYCRERARQKFTAVQFVTTQWRAAPGGDRAQEPAYTGVERIKINPAFFQRLDRKIDVLNKAGLLAAPVMLWAIRGGSAPQVNPGVSLPDNQAILLARYMVGRWGSHAVLWMLAGDGDYRGPRAERWKRIGRAVFGDIPQSAVTMHPGGMHWILDDFKDEPWMNVFGYQSGHGDDDKTMRWVTEGPLTQDWTKTPHRPFINLEPPYEAHLAYQSRRPISAEHVRRVVYWSLLNAPTAGVSYGGHGVWGWDDGTKPPTDHPGTGTPQPWKKAIHLPAAEQMRHLHDFFTGIDWWRLYPAPMLVLNQPGKESARRFVAAGRTLGKDLLVVYVPEGRVVEIALEALPPAPRAFWHNPRTGQKSPAKAVLTPGACRYATPAAGDWILHVFKQKSKR